jgi:hypothetical protein
MNRKEMDRMMAAVSKAQERLRDSHKTVQLLDVALNVGYFLCLGHGYDFDDYLAAFRDPAQPYDGFECDDDFHTWTLVELEAGRVPRGVVEIDSVRFSIGYTRARGDAMLLRIPSPEQVRRPRAPFGQERLWDALDKAYEVLRGSADDVEGLHCAALGLHFVHESGCATEYGWFLSHLEEDVPPLCIFRNKEEAEEWLNTHPRPPNGALIAAGSEAYMVGYWRETGQRALVRMLTIRKFVKEEPRGGGDGGGGFVN